MDRQGASKPAISYAFGIKAESIRDRQHEPQQRYTPQAKSLIIDFIVRNNPQSIEDIHLGTGFDRRIVKMALREIHPAPDQPVIREEHIFRLHPAGEAWLSQNPELPENIVAYLLGGGTDSFTMTMAVRLVRIFRRGPQQGPSAAPGR